MNADKLREWRRKAEECRQAAEASPTDEERALFLNLAEQWMRLAQGLDATLMLQPDGADDRIKA